MKLRFLGTGAAVPSARRSHVSFVLWAGQAALVECGPTVPWQLVRMGLDHREIADVFLSHVHGDHSLGLPMLIMIGELEGRSSPLRVYCPSSAVERLKLICTSCYPSLETVIRDKVEWHSLPDDSSTEARLEGGALLVTAPGIHGVPDVALRLDFEGRSVVYSGDTAPAHAVRELARGADLLLHDATWSESIDGMTSPDHSSCSQAGQIAAEAGVSRLGLVHVHSRYLAREDELRAEAAAHFGGRVFIPSDGETLDV